MKSRPNNVDAQDIRRGTLERFHDRRAARREAALAEAKYRCDQERSADGTERVKRWLFVGVNDF